MTRQTSPVVAARNVALRERIATLKGEHPFWGYRRVWAHLRFMDGWTVNRKRILRLMRAHQWLVPRTSGADRHPERRASVLGLSAGVGTSPVYGRLD
jgi:hypothetical protein